MLIVGSCPAAGRLFGFFPSGMLSSEHPPAGQQVYSMNNKLYFKMTVKIKRYT